MKEFTPRRTILPADLYQRFKAAGQDHIFRYWDELENTQRRALIEQAGDVDLEVVGRLAAGKGLAAAPGTDLAPADVLSLEEEPSFASRAAARRKGEELLRAGKVGVFLVAGGQGSRLGYDGPKGCVEAGPLSGKSLFQLHIEKLKALGAFAGVRVPLYVMVSDANREATASFLERHRRFGLREADVILVTQRMMPALDAAGKLILLDRGSLFLSPNGHGGAFEALQRGGCLADARSRGIEHIFYFQVDNPLIRIADPPFLGLHALSRSQFSLKVLRKTGPEEKIGVVARESGRTTIVEYSDLDKRLAEARGPDGRLLYWAGSIAIHAFHVPFLEKVASGEVELPYHIAKKKARCLDDSGAIVEREVLKYERFVFDALPAAERAFLMEVRREEEFAPIKNRSGVDSLDSARDMLMAEHRRWLERAGVRVETGSVEVSPEAALDEEQLAARIREGGLSAVLTSAHIELDSAGKLTAATATRRRMVGLIWW